MHFVKQNLISVIVAVHNRERYLRKCIDSIICQKSVNLEIILIDDGSTDKSADICDEYALNYENIMAVHKKNKGLSSARNTGLDIANGSYIAFVDDDDFLAEDSLKTLLDIQLSYNADLVVGNYAEYTDDWRYSQTFIIPEKYCNRVLNKREVCELLFYSDKTHFLMVSWGKIYKREVWNGLRFDEEVPYAEDQFVFPELIEKCNKIYLTDRVVYNQVLTTVSLVRGPVSRRHLFNSAGIAKVTDYLIQQGYFDIALYKFGLGSRHLIFLKRVLHDNESKLEVKRQNNEYKNLARKLFTYVDIKNKVRLLLFCISLDIYDKVRSIYAARLKWPFGKEAGGKFYK